MTWNVCPHYEIIITYFMNLCHCKEGENICYQFWVNANDLSVNIPYSHKRRNSHISNQCYLHLV